MYAIIANFSKQDLFLANDDTIITWKHRAFGAGRSIKPGKVHPEVCTGTRHQQKLDSLDALESIKALPVPTSGCSNASGGRLWCSCGSVWITPPKRSLALEKLIAQQQIYLSSLWSDITVEFVENHIHQNSRTCTTLPSLVDYTFCFRNASGKTTNIAEILPGNARTEGEEWPC